MDVSNGMGEHAGAMRAALAERALLVFTEASR